jgi:predicted enzyme related to lactoylglutathione lyase
MDPIGSINGLVIDGDDTHALAAFWSALFATSVESDENDGHYIDLLPTREGLVLRFQRVPEMKTIKNRLHLDVEVDDVEEAVRRVERLGGSVVRRPEDEYGWRFVIMADPEGNEFCLIHRTDDRPAS